VRALRQNPERSGYGWEALGVHYRWRGDTEKEKQAFLEGIKHSPNGRYYMRLSQIEFDRKNFPEAEEYAVKGAAILSDDFKAQGVCGYVFFFQNKLTEAAPYLSKAIMLGSDNGNHFAMMAYIFLVNGKPQDARNLLLDGFKKAHNPNEQYYCVLGRAEEELGNYQEALTHYQKATRINSQSYWGQQAQRGMERIQETGGGEN
jgi:tetratricopeptide (TPR) repeat protein